MHRATYEWLRLLYGQFDAREFGKLCQKFLAITYRRAGFAHVVEPGVQGVDVDAAGGKARYATEVKTTIRAALLFQAKDALGLAARRTDGYLPLVGVLRLSPLSDWLLVDAEHLGPGWLMIDRLRPYRRRELEEQLRPVFAAAVDEHAEAALAGGQGYLDRVLYELGIEQQAEWRVARR
jgi:hypothetical protein